MCLSLFFKRNLKLSPLIFVYIVFHRGQDGEHSHKKSPRKSADPGVIYDIPEKILSNYLAAYIFILVQFAINFLQE